MVLNSINLLEKVSNSNNEQFVKVLLIMLAVSLVLTLINLVIDFLLFDVINGASLALSLATGTSFLLENYEFNDLWLYLLLGYSIIVILSYYLFYKFIVPNSEFSNTISERNYIGEKAVVSTTIPESGIGEVVITVSLQRIAKPARIYKQLNDQNNATEIKSGEKVRVYDVKDGVLEVVPDTIKEFF